MPNMEFVSLQVELRNFNGDFGSKNVYGLGNIKESWLS